MMAETLTLTHERVDDLPLLVGLMQQLRFPALFDQSLGTHGLHQGLSPGGLATGWLAFILSEADHRKSTVQAWAQQHDRTLSQLLGQPLRPVEFSDDRLGGVLRRLSDTPRWEALEAALWQATVAVYALDQDLTGVRLDSTTAAGHHTPTPDGLMQFGHSKDHRPDLPQRKLMAAAAEPAGHLLTSDVHPGQAADDPLSVPLLRRVRQVVGRTGVLYTGDCKMGALATRADIVAHGDYSLVPLAAGGEAGAQFAAWIDAIVDGDQPATLLYDAEGELVGAGYECPRALTDVVDGQPVTWTERVLVVRSRTLAREQTAQLAHRLERAEAALRALTPPPGPGRHPHRDEASLQAAVDRVLARYRVAGLLHVTWAREEATIARYVGPGRGGPQRRTRTEVQVRYVVTGVERDAAALAHAEHRLGWRVYGTNAPAAWLPLAQAVLHYRGGWCLERDFHLRKDRPLGSSPLSVRRDDQLVGLTRLLTLALRVLTLLESQVRRGLAQAQATLAGLYPGQPARTTARPTAVRLLRAIARTQITLTRADLGGRHQWHLTPLPDLLQRVLTYLGLAPSLYARLAENSS